MEPPHPLVLLPSHRSRLVQEEHGIGDRLLHNIAQEATWDASARCAQRFDEDVGSEVLCEDRKVAGAHVCMSKRRQAARE